MASGCTITSKVSLVIFGLLFWGAAAGLFYVGGWVFNTYQHFDEITKANFTLIPASIIITIGIFMFFVGILACCAAFKENKCLLATLFSLLLVILTAEVAAGALGYAFKDDVSSAVEDGMKSAFNGYNGTDKDQVDYVQQELKCCGISNASDWLTSETWSKHHENYVPQSCCKSDVNCTIDHRTSPFDSEYIYTTGCYDKLEALLLKNLAYIAGVAISFAIIQILGMICSCVLFCRSKEVRYQALGGQYSGLRV